MCRSERGGDVVCLRCRLIDNDAAVNDIDKSAGERDAWLGQGAGNQPNGHDRGFAQSSGQIDRVSEMALDNLVE